MKQDRLKRAESISKKLLSEYLISEFQELSVDFWIVTITDVSISSDLSYLDISVSSLRNTEELTKKLSEHAHEMHRFLGKKIEFIKVPRIRFRYDETGKTSFEFHQTLHELDIK